MSSGSSTITRFTRLRRGTLPDAPQRPAARQGPGRRVDQDDAGVEPVAHALGPIDAIAVAELVGQAIDPDVPVVAGAVVPRVERDLGGDLGVARLREDQRDRRAVAAEQDEVDPRRCVAWRRAARDGPASRSGCVPRIRRRETSRADVRAALDGERRFGHDSALAPVRSRPPPTPARPRSRRDQGGPGPPRGKPGRSHLTPRPRPTPPRAVKIVPAPPPARSLRLTPIEHPPGHGSPGVD